MRAIQLTRGKVAIVDDEDFIEVAQYRWCCSVNGYPVRSKRVDGKKKVVYLHREIMGSHPDGLVVDHINGDKCDNRRENLRWVTRAQNNFNQRLHKTNTTGFKGVQYVKRTKSFMARINVNNKGVYLGYFKTAEEAKRAYNEAALKFRGEFANLN